MADPAATIAAIATAVAPGQGSVAIVRLSGPAALAIGRRLFQAPGSQVWESHRILYGHVVDPASGERIDEALLLLMQAPRSFTGEDVVEFHCHGGLICVQRVLELVLACGARRAQAGEFSQRAFLNGRLDLTRAEAVSDLVTARSRRAAQLALAGLDGGLQRRISGLRERLLDQLAELEARVDFEEDLPLLDGAAVAAELAAVRFALEELVAGAAQGQLLREGLRVAIVGRPNVGKSSLLNRLSRSERAIVTDLPGTTRDLVESELVLQGVPLTLLDTAGIRSTDDRIEQLGIERSRSALASAEPARTRPCGPWCRRGWPVWWWATSWTRGPRVWVPARSHGPGRQILRRHSPRLVALGQEIGRLQGPRLRWTRVQRIRRTSASALPPVPASTSWWARSWPAAAPAATRGSRWPSTVARRTWPPAPQPAWGAASKPPSSSCPGISGRSTCAPPPSASARSPARR